MAKRPTKRSTPPDVGEQVESAIHALQAIDHGALIRASIDHAGTTAGAVECLLSDTLTSLRRLLAGVADG